MKIHRAVGASRCLPVSLMLAVALLGACTTAQRPVQDPHPRLQPSKATGEMIPGLGTEPDPVDSGLVDTEMFAGAGTFIDEEAARRRPPPVTAEGEIVLNFEGESIQSVVHTILGEVLQETYVIGPGVSGQVTFATSKPVSRAQLMPILELLLRWNGATLVFHEGRYHVLPVSDAIPGHLVPRLGPAAQAMGYEVRVVPLEYISATEMAKILEPYVRDNAVVSVDPIRNMVFVAGTREELSNYLQTIEIFDVDWLAGMSVGIYPLQTVDVQSITTELSAIFGLEGDGPAAGLFRFVPMDRLGAVMVITPHERYLRRAEQWIERLDRGAAGAGSQLFVYRVKNLEAQVLASYLSQLFGGTGAAPQRQRPTNLAPGLEPVTRGSVSDFNANRAQANRGGLQTGNQQGGAGGAGTATIQAADGSEIRITSVVETNSLLIQATPGQYASIQAAIERIDEVPLQVLIESQVFVVELVDELAFGVNWFLTNNPGLIPEGAGNPFGRVVDQASFGANPNFLTVLSDTISDGRTFIQATITALDSISDVRAISAPSLVVRNNSSANINVGVQVPVQSAAVGGINNQVVTSAQYVSTGTTLDVTPRINPGGLVYLDISQEVSTPGVPVGENPNPPINTRTVTSQVAVQSGETVFLGGLIQETETLTSTGVPFLSRIPGLGALFGRKGDRKERNETIVMITPTVLESIDDLRTITDDLEDEFIRVEPIKITTLQDDVLYGRRDDEQEGTDQ